MREVLTQAALEIKDSEERTAERLYSRYVSRCLETGVSVTMNAASFYDQVREVEGAVGGQSQECAPPRSVAHPTAGERGLHGQREHGRAIDQVEDQGRGPDGVGAHQVAELRAVEARANPQQPRRVEGREQGKNQEVAGDRWHADVWMTVGDDVGTRML